MNSSFFWLHSMTFALLLTEQFQFLFALATQPIFNLLTKLNLALPFVLSSFSLKMHAARFSQCLCMPALTIYNSTTMPTKSHRRKIMYNIPWAMYTSFCRSPLQQSLDNEIQQQQKMLSKAGIMCTLKGRRVYIIRIETRAQKVAFLPVELITHICTSSNYMKENGSHVKQSLSLINRTLSGRKQSFCKTWA